MKKSVVTLYNMNFTMDESRNFIIEDIDDYITANKNATKIISDFQYIKHELDLEITIPLNQKEQDKLTYDYCTIQNISEKMFYYFIKSCVWASDQSVTLVLKLDTLNTFSNGTDYYINNKTNIIRKHEDRFTMKENPTLFEKAFEFAGFESGYSIYRYSFINEFVGVITDDDIYKVDYSNKNSTDTVRVFASEWDEENNRWLTTIDVLSLNNYALPSIQVKIVLNVLNLTRIIDVKAEGLNFPKYKTNEEVIVDDKDEVASKWFLIYRNNDAINPNDFNQVNPVNTYLVADTEFNMLDYDLTTFVNITMTDTYPCFIVSYLQDNEANGMVRCYTGANGTGTAAQFNLLMEDKGIHYVVGYGNVREVKYWGVRFLKEGADYTAQQIIMTQYRDPYSDFPLHYEYQTYGSKVNVKSITFPSQQLNYAESSSETLQQSSQYTNTWSRTRVLTATAIKTISDIDRTDSRLIKIIKLPYCPLNISVYDDGGYSDVVHFTDFTDYEVSDNMIKLNLPLSPLSKKLYHENFFKPLYYGINKTMYITRRNIDSKLYNSEFYNKKMVYDSFAFDFKFESYDVDEGYKDDNGADKMEISFYTTNTINSRFLCKFEKWLEKYAQQDYDNILYISRNNEMTIFSNQYINYLRTGYNYDVKAKERQINQNVMNMGTSLLNAGINMTNPFNVGSNLIMMPNHIMSSLYSIAQAEDNLNRKISEAKYQATSVFGADDVDLLDVYTNDNKFKICEYSVSDRVKKHLDDLFYFYGYACNDYDVPSYYMQSRLWFNYIQANIKVQTSYIKEEFMNDIIDKYAEGVTFLHANTISDVKQWDYEQQLENWETSLIESHYIY